MEIDSIYNMEPLTGCVGGMFCDREVAIAETLFVNSDCINHLHCRGDVLRSGSRDRRNAIRQKRRP